MTPKRTRIYVASSWRNERQPVVVEALRLQGFQVYDFRNPAPGVSGCHWSDIDPEWKTWTPEEFRTALWDPIAVKGYNQDSNAMMAADICVLVLPCGGSAHLEAGWFVGAGKPVIILLADGAPELMYNMAASIAISIADMLNAVEGHAGVLAAKRGGARVCGGCGCDDLHACVTKDGPCYWVADDLCSACKFKLKIINQVEQAKQ